MNWFGPIVVLAAVSSVSTAHALTEANVYLFKGDKNGTLHMVGQPTDKSKTDASVIIGNKELCGKLQKDSESTAAKNASEAKGNPVCLPGYSGEYRFSRQHMFSDKDIPVALGFDNCSIKPMRDNALHPSKQLIEGFKSGHNLPKYLSERAKVFVGADGSKYLSFIGIKAKTKKAKDPETNLYEVDGVAKRDFFLFDMESKKFVLDKRDQVCCDPKNENVYLCNLPKMVETACFESNKNLEKFQGLVADSGKLYAYAVDSGTEGVHGYVWQIENNSQKQIYHQTFYAVEGCK